MKNIQFATNFNGKLSCHRFAHIDLAPAAPVSMAAIQAAIIQITVADNSHPPVVVKLDSIVPFKLAELSNIHTWPSHGMDTAEFMEWQHIHMKGGLRKETMLAVYYYRKVG
jgi:hypothetical protein